VVATLSAADVPRLDGRAVGRLLGRWDADHTAAGEQCARPPACVRMPRQHQAALRGDRRARSCELALARSLCRGSGRGRLRSGAAARRACHPPCCRLRAVWNTARSLRWLTQGAVCLLVLTTWTALHALRQTRLRLVGDTRSWNDPGVAARQWWRLMYPDGACSKTPVTAATLRVRRQRREPELRR
jgi:hypothetical protein